MPGFRTSKVALGIAVLMLAAAPMLGGNTQAADQPWLTFPGGKGPGQGKHIVLISGDEEYRSEEALPQLAKILSQHHGFKCTVLFAIDPQTGEINPDKSDNIPGLEALKDADLMVIFTRFRHLPDDQMKYIADYIESGRPIVAMRTATHAFNYPKGSTSPYAKYSFNSGGDYKGGFGRQVLGETWVAHHGHHGKESTRGVIAPGQEKHPIVQGVKDIWGPTDVYTVRPAEGSIEPIVIGQVLSGMNPDDSVTSKAEMPVAWVREVPVAEGKPARVFCTTMGASQDLLSEGVRRMLVNACYWGMGMSHAIDPNSSVEIVGKYEPLPFGFRKFTRGVKPADLR